MRFPHTAYIMLPLLAGLSLGVARAGAHPAALDQEEYLDAEEWFQTGLALNSAGNYREAAEAFGRSVAIDPENPLAWMNLGTARALLGDYGEAIGALRKALRLDPKLALALSNLGEVYFRTEHFQEALDTYSALIELLPGDPEAHYRRGLSFLALNDAGKAQGEYLALKLLDPGLAARLQQAIDQRLGHK